MPNARVLAAAGGLPSRRAALAALAGAGAALSLPRAARATTAQTSPDAALIAQAALVERLAVLARQAWARASKADDACTSAEPERPEREFFTADDLHQQIAEAERDASDSPWNAEWIAERRSRLARLEAYEAECVRLERKFRVDASYRIACRADGRCREATDALTAMRPTTLAGVHAKARAAHAVTNDDTMGDRWMLLLSSSLVRDVIAIGGAA